MDQLIEDDIKIYSRFCDKMNQREPISGEDLTLAYYTLFTKYKTLLEDPLFDYLENQVLDDYGIMYAKDNMLGRDIHKNRPLYKIPCAYSEYCELCNSGTTNSNLVSLYCFKCYLCQNFRNTDKEYNIKKANVEYKKALIIKDQTISLQKNEETNSDVINYIETKDKYFEVWITNKNTVNLKLLKRVFIYNMCRRKAIELYPDEDDYNYANTYPVMCAIYCIEYENDKPVLHGLIRYMNMNDGKSWINKKKVKEELCMNKSIIITVNQINYFNNAKYFIDKKQVTNVYNNIIKRDHFGSSLKEFCEDTL